jgi:hypothetical protein
VPLYDSLGENAIEYIVNHSEAVAAFTSSEKLPNLVKALPHCKEHLKTVVYWGAGSPDAAKVRRQLPAKPRPPARSPSQQPYIKPGQDHTPSLAPSRTLPHPAARPPHPLTLRPARSWATPSSPLPT